MGSLEQRTSSGLWVPAEMADHMHDHQQDAVYKAQEYMDLAKAMPTAPPARAPKSQVFDPLSLMYSMGYKHRRHGLSYNVLRQMAQQLSVVGAIINTRVHQVASFCSPFRQAGTTGFIVKHKDPERKLTGADKKRIMEIEDFILRCGRPEQNKHAASPRSRLGFEDFTKAYMRDSFTLDQATFEIVPDRKKRPFEVIPTDASTHRFAADRNDLGMSRQRRRVRPPQFGLGQFDHIGDWDVDKIAYIQLVNGRVENVYTQDELSFGLRNPQTNIEGNGYGLSELEQLITVVTSHLFAEEYNRSVFQKGSIPKGIVNIKDEDMDQENFEAFRRRWMAMVAGASNAFRTPVMQSAGVEWIPFMPNNREMEYEAWILYLIKVASAVFLIDPAEINFDVSNQAGGQPLFESSSEWRIKKSRDRGLRPALRYYARRWNEDVLSKLDDRYYMDLVGLDELSQKEQLEIRQQELTLFRTVNEVRVAEDLPPIDGGDLILSPTFVQALQMQQQMAMEQQQMEAQQQQAAQMAQEPAQGAEEPPAEGEAASDDQAAQGEPEALDASAFTKGIKPVRHTRILEVELSDD